MICDDMLISSFFAFTPEYIIWCRNTEYLIRLSDLLHAFQDQENVIVPVMFSWGEKLFCPYPYTHEDIREFVCNNSLEARIGKQNVHGNKVYSGMERQKNVYPSLQIVLPTSQQTPLSKFVIWFMTC